MDDEKYVYLQDLKEKKLISRNASKKNKKGKGRILFTNELNKKNLNGEVVAYMLNKPMIWKEFKKLPEGIKTKYIEFLREKFDVPDFEIYTMLGCSYSTWWAELKRLGIPSIKNKKNGINGKYNKGVWNEWLHQGKETMDLEEEVQLEEVVEVPGEIVLHEVVSGNLSFESNIDSVYKTLKSIMGDKRLQINVSWKEIDPKSQN